MSLTKLSHMREYRSFVSLVELNDEIYALGGLGGWWLEQGQRLGSVEVYNISQNQWRTVRPMHMIRSDFGAAVVKGKIFVVGGFDGDMPRDSAEEYNLASIPILGRGMAAKRPRADPKGISSLPSG